MSPLGTLPYQTVLPMLETQWLSSHTLCFPFSPHSAGQGLPSRRVIRRPGLRGKQHSWAPEMVPNSGFKSIDIHAADVYSLGTIMTLLLTGRHLVGPDSRYGEVRTRQPSGQGDSA
jgi:hypothetical protein